VNEIKAVVMQNQPLFIKGEKLLLIDGISKENIQKFVKEIFCLKKKTKLFNVLVLIIHGIVNGVAISEIVQQMSNCYICVLLEL
jgi:hypothetical protein